MGEEPTRKEAAECLRDLGNRKLERLADAQQYLESLQETVMQLVPQVCCVRIYVCMCVCIFRFCHVDRSKDISKIDLKIDRSIDNILVLPHPVYVLQGAVWQDLTLGETICHTLSGFLAHNLERLVGPEDAKALQQPGVRCMALRRREIFGFWCLCCAYHYVRYDMVGNNPPTLPHETTEPRAATRRGGAATHDGAPPAP